MAKRSPELTRIKARHGLPWRMNVRFLLGVLTLTLIAGVVIYASMVPAPRAEKSVQLPDQQPGQQLGQQQHQQQDQQPGEIR